MVPFSLSSGRYSAEEISELKGVFCTLSGFAGRTLHEDTNGYEAIYLLRSGISSAEEIGEMNTPFWDTNGYEAMVYTMQKNLVS